MPTMGNTGQRGWYGKMWRAYGGEFWTFAAIIAPAVLFSYLAIQTGLHIASGISAHLRSEMLSEGLSGAGAFMRSHLKEIAVMGLARWGAFCASWIFSCFAFSAVAVAVERLEQGHQPRMEECYAPVRERMGSFLKSALVLFAILGFASMLSILASFKLFDVFGTRIHFPMFYEATGLLILLPAFWLVARFAFVFPILVLENKGAFAAFQRSEFLTEPVRGRLLILLVESEIGGFIGAMLPYWIAAMVPTELPWPPWIPWVLAALSVTLAGLAQLPMMIGISQAYLEARAAGARDTEKLRNAGLDVS